MPTPKAAPHSAAFAFSGFSKFAAMTPRQHVFCQLAINATGQPAKGLYPPGQAR